MTLAPACAVISEIEAYFLLLFIPSSHQNSRADSLMEFIFNHFLVAVLGLAANMTGSNMDSHNQASIKVFSPLAQPSS